MAEPRILDAKGNPLSVGDRVLVFPDTKRPDESTVKGFKRDSLGWRVFHSWLSGYHPDEPDPSEAVEATADPDVFTCTDLELLQSPKREAATTAPQPRGGSQ